MIFIGYSSKDRYTIVESMVFHLKNYGFNVWYDFHDMYLSDARFETNFEHGIKDSKYVIFILSPNFFTSKCAVEELDYAQTLYEQGTIKLFPILYLLEANQLPEHYNWIRKIIYNEINKNSGTLFVTNQIIEKLLYDQVKTMDLRSMSEIAQYCSNNNLCYLHKLAEAFINLDLGNYSARIAMLYSMYLYVDTQNENNTIDIIIHRIINFTSFNISLDHLSFSIFQLAVIIKLNKYLRQNL